MKHLLSLLAEYNRQVNGKLYAIVAELSQEDRTRNVGSYHRSLFGVLSHVYASDLGWMRRLDGAFGPYKALSIPEMKDALPERGAPIFSDYETLSGKRPALDGAIRELVAEAQESDLEKTFTFTTFAGNQKSMLFWQGLMHMFNHETHHRGVIAQILDEMKVENDYSGIIAVL